MAFLRRLFCFLLGHEYFVLGVTTAMAIGA